MNARIKPYIQRLMLVLLFLCCQAGSGSDAQSLSTPFPSGFRNTRPNELQGSASLHPVFEKLKRGLPVRVMQIGDSHVKGKYLPQALESTLRATFPGIRFSFYGINGAWARRFYEHDMISRVAAENPDLLVISFGTNEAHGSALDRQAHAKTMDLLTQRIRERCPDVCFLFTTPPGSYLSQRVYRTTRGRRRRTTVKVVNPNTPDVANSIVRYCQERQMAVWDLYTIAGGEQSACTNWRDAGLMNTDLVHFLTTGYTLQGTLLGEAICKAYEEAALPGTQTRMMHGSTPLEQKPYKSVAGF